MGFQSVYSFIQPYDRTEEATSNNAGKEKEHEGITASLLSPAASKQRCGFGCQQRRLENEHLLFITNVQIYNCASNGITSVEI